MVNHSIKGRQLQFGLAIALFVVTLCAICAAWAGAQLRWIRARNQFGDIGVHWPGSIDDAPWQLRPFGEYGAPQIRLPEEADEKNENYLRRMRSLFPESQIFLRDGRILMPDGSVEHQ